MGGGGGGGVAELHCSISTTSLGLNIYDKFENSLGDRCSALIFLT